MSRRSTVFTRLPPPIRAQLDRRLIANGFGGYDELIQWLHRRGYRISKSALNRYGVELQHRERELALISAGEQTLTLAELGDKDSATMARGLVRLIQSQIFMMLANNDGELKVDDLARLAHTITDLAHAALALHPENLDSAATPASSPARPRQPAAGRSAAAPPKPVAATDRGLSAAAADAIREALGFPQSR